MPNPWFRSYIGLQPADGGGAGGARVLIPTATFVAGPDPLNLTAGARCDLDLTQDAMAASMLYVQSLYLDLADVPAINSISVIHLETTYRIKAKGQTQGWYPIIGANTMKYTITGPSGLIGTSLRIMFANTPAEAMQWATA